MRLEYEEQLKPSRTMDKVGEKQGSLSGRQFPFRNEGRGGKG